MARELDLVVERFAKDVETSAGSSLRSIVLYGSAATTEYVPSKSDLNFLVVVESLSSGILLDFQRRMAGWGRARIATPLLVPWSFLASSTDSYPLEILGMMAAYRTVRGDDPFGDLRIGAEHVRLQAERELKAKQLLLRRGYLESCGKHGALKAYLAGVSPGLEAILRGLLYVRGGDWKRSGAEFRAACSEIPSVDHSLLDLLRAIRAGKARPNREQTLALYERVVALLDSLAHVVER